MVNPVFILVLSRARTFLLLLFLSFTITVEAQQVQLQFSKGTKDEIPTSFKQLSPSDLSKHLSFWVQVTILSDVDQHLILKAGNWYMQQVSFYDNAGKAFYIGNNIEVSLLKGDNTFYLYFPFVDDKDSNGLTVSVTPVHDFNTDYFDMRTNQVFFAAAVGMLLLLSFMYSIFIRSKDKIYIHYALYLFSILVFFTYQYGIPVSVNKAKADQLEFLHSIHVLQMSRVDIRAEQLANPVCQKIINLLQNNSSSCSAENATTNTST